MIAGIGCRAGVTGEQVEAAIDGALEALRTNAAGGQRAEAATAIEAATTIVVAAPGTAARRLRAIATPASKANEPGIQAAATARGVPLLAITQTDLEAANLATVTKSARSLAAMNVNSVAEAAALAGATALANCTAARAAAAAAADPTNAATHPAPPAGNPNASGPSAAAAYSPCAAPRLLLPRITIGPVTCALADDAMADTIADTLADVIAAPQPNTTPP